VVKEFSIVTDSEGVFALDFVSTTRLSSLRHYSMVDYNLDSLGSRNFEHLSQALAAKVFGPKLTVFGDGPDGGREATWEGNAPSLGALPDWEGYGVVQAKFKVRPETPAGNLVWLKSEVRKELIEWAEPDTRRTKKPDYLLFITNVGLSSVPESGKDAIKSYTAALVAELKLSIREVRTWDYSDLVPLLDDADDIRKRYSAFITPGDIIAKLLDDREGLPEAFGQAISAYTARALRDEALLNLTQAGTVGDGQVTIGDVFVDLPADLPPQPWAFESQADVTEVETLEDEGAAFNELDFDLDLSGQRSGITRHLINDFNHIPESRRDDSAHPHRTVLVGGPGQGKSTVTQWLAQTYRAEFLSGSVIAAGAEVAVALKKIKSRNGELDMPEVTARRWPVRVVLTELADYLAKSPDSSLLHYLAAKVSDRSSFSVDSPMLRKWLALYPWLLLIDGLDEVPDSSNRAQVMTSIQDFFLDVSAIGGDVAAVATTRPQGYGDEFSPNDYRHFQLNSLHVDEALKYAEGLVGIRTGSGTPAAQKVMDRLIRASSEEHTQRLFESPLQVTILEILLEKLGKAPSDRSRLYSAYYNVISQREQEKSGALSDLLQRYESDVTYLHRRIGFELQQRSSEVGETSAYISTEEFQQFIVDRFEFQGHSKDEVATLSREFELLVTDRLVFLAKLQANRIGFELRSLQEFMASEFIVNIPEHRVITEVQRIAQSPFWRNVVLFAIGSIFAHREHLRAEVYLLCDRLNDGSSASRVVLPGSELALDVLRDGSCASMPRYSRSLAKLAMRLLESPIGPKTSSLAFLLDSDLGELLWAEMESFSPANASTWINRISLLSTVADKEGDRALSLIQRIFDYVDLETKRHVIGWAWDTLDVHVRTIVASRFALCPPDRFFAQRSPNHRRAVSRREESNWPDWMRNLYLLTGEPSRSRSDDDPVFEDDLLLRAVFVELGADNDSWKWVENLNNVDSRWGPLQELAHFARSPTAESLASALDAFASENVNGRPGRAPWPFVACMHYVDLEVGSGRAQSALAASHALSSHARTGGLGDREDWLAAQKRWGSGVVVSEELVSDSSERPTRLPLWPELAHTGWAPMAYNYFAYDVHGPTSRENLFGLIRTMVDHSAAEVTWMDIAMFLASMIANQKAWTENPESRGQLVEIRNLIEDQLPLRSGRSDWISWLALAPVTDGEPRPDVLRLVGKQERLLGSVGETAAAQLAIRAAEIEDGFSLLRIALVSDPSLIESIPDSAFTSLAEANDAPVGAFFAARALLGADERALWGGDLDEEFRLVQGESRGALGAGWFTRLIDNRAEPNTIDIAARGAQLFSRTSPSLAESWLEIARKRSRSNPIASIVIDDADPTQGEVG